ncbi:Cytochrome c [Algoriphagus faecimaris]|uniref:Cytochrome c n=1 Tax=Algoriphagus faecimaris TaxID=686796 RepID=A0A1G6NKP4_9BACT|nr:c-type cytochrome [Algoriphagus faecimaris]SDC67735.1 Cytochrome c [Algoriphagus faecimaris]
MSYERRLFSSTVLIISSFFYFSCQNQEEGEELEPIAEAQVDSHQELLERGKYLIEIMGCNDCHSPKKMGERGPEIIPELALSGFPADRPILKFEDPLIKEGFGMMYPDLTGAAGPWGLSFAANLTPHETGLGNWTLEQFTIALREGKSKGIRTNRMLLPPMPWQNYVGIKDEDIAALFEYLQSIPPVDNRVPQPIEPQSM